ncbi:MAG: LysM peptidoglycan-binding domain-containing protein [Bythopirellula sp.]
MSRSRKLLIVAVVVAVGWGLAWPFRKTAIERTVGPVVKSPTLDQQANGTSTDQPAWQPVQLDTTAPHVTAKMASTADAKHAVDSRARTSFDLADHPALAATAATSPSPVLSPVTPPVPPKVQAPPADYRPAQVQEYPGDARPAYSTTATEQSVHVRAARPVEVRHVVQNSDTLEKLAKRYLGSEDRALEIFDLNRDVLDNPHLLPIDAELRIPADARKTID